MSSTVDRHDAVVAFVRQYRNEFNVGPSYAEVATAAGYASPAAARKAVMSLCKAGRLTKYDGIARSLDVAPDGQ